jgi:carboxypeptidase C (cathepsin A)
MATPQFGTWYTINHLDLGPLRGNITERHYLGGHMMYHNPPARAQLHRDIAAFIHSALPKADDGSSIPDEAR